MSHRGRFAFVAVALLAAPLGGCLGVETASLSSGDAMVARAPEITNTPDTSDDLAGAKANYRARNFGLAEQGFQRAVEASPSSAEAWLGLAATHDQLGRFDLADRDYAQVEKKAGAGFELLNNRGYSYMMRGDFRRARADFERAARLRPDSAFVRNNLRELEARMAARR